MEDFLALTHSNAVLFEVFVFVAVIPFETDDIGKNPHTGSVYASLYTVKRTLLCACAYGQSAKGSPTKPSSIPYVHKYAEGNRSR